MQHFRQGKLIEFGQCCGKVTCAASLQRNCLLNGQVKADSRKAHCIAAHELQDMAGLCTGAAHKLETGRHIVEEVTHSNCRTMQARALPTLRHLATTHCN